MKCRVFTIVSVLSLVLGLTTAALWVLSYTFSDLVEFTGDFHSSMLGTSRGEILVGLITEDRTHVEGYGNGFSHHRETTSLEAFDVQWRDNVAGFKLSGEKGFKGSFYGALVPYWFLETMCLIMPLTSLRQWRKRHGYSPTQCHHCGYDLRATPDRCPECGTVAVRKVIA